MTSYYYNIADVDTSLTTVTQIVTVGSRTLTFTFQWAVASEEQAQLVDKYLTRLAASDPLKMADGGYNREYDWYSYYIALASVDLDEWLDSDPTLPVSVLKEDTRAGQKQVLRRNISTASTLSPVILLYSETLRWQFQVTCADTDTITGLVEPGGWFRNQDSKFAFRFHSARTYIGKEDINELALEFEVYDE